MSVSKKVTPILVGAAIMMLGGTATAAETPLKPYPKDCSRPPCCWSRLV
jgi:hypothetical protein